MVLAMLINLIDKFKEYFLHMLLIGLAFVSPIIPLIILVGVCIGIDTITGIAKAYKLGEEISSRKLSNIVGKMVLYQASIILFFAIEKFILHDFIIILVNIPYFITKLVAITLVMIELISVNENLNEGFKINLWNQFKLMLKRAKKVKKEIEDNEKILND